MTNKATKTAKTDTYDGSTMLRSVMQEAVLDSILAGTFQTDAYLEHYPTCKSKRVAEAAASRLLSNVRVKARLDYLRRQLAAKTEITAEKVLKEMAKIGFSNIQDFTSRGNAITDISELDPSIAAAIESVQSDIRYDSGRDSEGYTEKVKIKLHSKLGALNSLAEILKLKDVAGKTDIKILQIGGLEPLIGQ